MVSALNVHIYMDTEFLSKVQCNGERAFSMNVLEQLAMHVYKNELEPYTKIQNGTYT